MNKIIMFVLDWPCDQLDKLRNWLESAKEQSNG